MLKGLFNRLGRGVKVIAQPATERVEDYQHERQIKRGRDEAISLSVEGKYVQAAEAYTRLAAEEMQDNPLIFQMYSHDSFRMWLKAKEMDKAMDQARQALSVLSQAGWLEKSSDAVNDLSQMVGELYVAGYTSEADSLSKEINAQLAAHGLASGQSSTSGSSESNLPTICPECGGPLPPSGSAAEIKCPYCGSVIHGG